LVLVIAILGALFRFAWLDYSEFQGDEALVMLAAADALEGHEDALLLRGKGPAEVLLTTAVWGLARNIDEGMARLPFALAGTLIPLLGFLLASSLFKGYRAATGVGVAAAVLLALNGFMVAFSRIVQYQVLVVLLSGLALWCSWQWRRQGSSRWLALCGLFIGSALLAHYDALLILPPIIYIIIKAWWRERRTANSLPILRGVLVAVVTTLLVAGMFYLPYGLDAQATRTGDYLSDRIGGTLLKNNLASFQHFNVFYTSFYYYALTGILVLGFLAWACRQAPLVRQLRGASWWFPMMLVLAILALMIYPEAFRTPWVDLAFLPFLLLLLGAFTSAELDDGQRAIVLWLATAFLGYNFGVALPLTHIYTIVPAWTLLAALSVVMAARYLVSPKELTTPLWRFQLSWPLAAIGLVVLGLFSGYLWLAYLRQDVEFRTDWPAGRTAIYWTPYAQPPPTGFFGFPHRTGWKAIGALYANGQLQGDYGSNEEADITAWYTRHAARACDAQPKYYLIASTVVDAQSIDMQRIQTEYEVFAEVKLTNGKGLVVYQNRPSDARLGQLDYNTLAAAFDFDTPPAAFARPKHGRHSVQADLGGLVRLVSYDLDVQRAYPDGRLTVTLYWQVLSKIEEDYHVFVHLEQEGSIWAQSDGRPVCWTYPTYLWRPGQVIADHHALHIYVDTPPGEYPVLVGMYRPSDGQRLDVFDATGNLVSNAVHLTNVVVGAP